MQRGDVAFCNLCLPSFLIPLMRKFNFTLADYSAGFLAPVGTNCNNPRMSDKQGVLKELFRGELTRQCWVFNHQMACLHPAVSSWRRAWPRLSWLTPVWRSRAYSRSDFRSSPRRRPALLDLHTVRSAPEREGAGPWVSRLGTAVGWRNLHMHDFCNLFARPVFMSMLIVGSAMVQL